MDFFLWEQVKKHVYVVCPRTIEDLVAILHAAMTTFDASMLICVRQNAIQVDGG
jgi:hypothetical protein